MSGIKQINSQKQTQSLLLKPKMLQSLEMLMLPLLELETYLKQEIVTNPMLEMKTEKDEDEEEKEKEPIEETGKEEKQESSDNDDEDKTLEEVKELSEVLDYWNEEFVSHRGTGSREEKADAEKYIKSRENYRKKIQLVIDRMNLTDDEKNFAYDMISSMDAYGFLPNDYDIQTEGEGYGITAKRAEEIHKMLMNINPKGLTARNIEECLIVQLDKNIEDYDNIKKIITNHFDDLIHKRYKNIASAFNVSTNTIIAWKKIISHLDPKPGLRIQSPETDYIVPEIILKKIDGKYEVIINDFYFPKIRMSRAYTKILQQVKGDRSGLEYVRGKINSAKFLIKSVYLRHKTLKRVVYGIIDYQHDFFYNKDKYLKPMIYSVIAEKMGVNESTISRVVSQKYIDTPFGIFRLKDFFTSKAGRDNNYNSVSRDNVEKIIKDLIINEDKLNPLSDQDITTILKERGLNISRRVVSKYRKSLGILNSHLRKT